MCLGRVSIQLLFPVPFYEWQYRKEKQRINSCNVKVTFCFAPINVKKLVEAEMLTDGDLGVVYLTNQNCSDDALQTSPTKRPPGRPTASGRPVLVKTSVFAF